MMNLHEIPFSIDFKDFETVLDDKCVAFSLLDTPGQDDYEHLRPLAYNNVSAFIICYSINNKVSFESISIKVIPELMQIFEWPVPVILVGKFDSLSRSIQNICESNLSQIYSIFFTNFSHKNRLER